MLMHCDNSPRKEKMVMAGSLAIDGGASVRRKPLPPPFPGGTMIGEEEKQSVLEVLEHRSPFRYYGPDPIFKVAALEKAFAAKMETTYALGVTSGTSALIVSLRALGIGPGDEVIVPAATFVACPGAVVACQAVPVFVDTDQDLHMDPQAVAQAITPRTKAIMPVHLRGMAADMDAILAVADQHGIPVVEDCAQSAGALYKGRYVGTMGKVGAFSFQMNKVLTAGEGGMVVTRDKEVYARAVACHDQGTVRKNDDVVVPSFCGENYRMTELAGAIMLEQLKKLDKLRAHVHRLGDIINDAVQDSPHVRQRGGADAPGQVGISVALIFASARVFKWVAAALKAEGTPIKHTYNGRPCYMNEALLQKRVWHNGPSPWDPRLYAGNVVYASGMCPVAEDVLSRMGEYHLGLDWTEADAADVAAALRKVLRAIPQELRAAS